MADGTERIIGALEESKKAISERLDKIDQRIDKLPCTEHLERMVRMEGKLDDLNNIKRTVRNSLLRWLVPYIVIGAIIAAAVSYIK